MKDSDEEEANEAEFAEF